VITLLTSQCISLKLHERFRVRFCPKFDDGAVCQIKVVGGSRRSMSCKIVVQTKSQLANKNKVTNDTDSDQDCLAHHSSPLLCTLCLTFSTSFFSFPIATNYSYFSFPNQTSRCASFSFSLTVSTLSSFKSQPTTNNNKDGRQIIHFALGKYMYKNKFHLFLHFVVHFSDFYDVSFSFFVSFLE